LNSPCCRSAAPQIHPASRPITSLSRNTASKPRANVSAPHRRRVSMRVMISLNFPGRTTTEWPAAQALANFQCMLGRASNPCGWKCSSGSPSSPVEPRSAPAPPSPQGPAAVAAPRPKLPRLSSIRQRVPSSPRPLSMDNQHKSECLGRPEPMDYRKIVYRPCIRTSRMSSPESRARKTNISRRLTNSNANAGFKPLPV